MNKLPKFTAISLFYILPCFLGIAGKSNAQGLSNYKISIEQVFLAQIIPEDTATSPNSKRIKGKVTRSENEETGMFSTILRFFDDLFFQKNKIQKLLDEKNYPQAENELKILLEQDPENLEYLKVYAAVLQINGKYAQAIETYTKIIKILPRDMDSRLGRARSSLGMKDYTAALKDFNYVLQRQKDNRGALKGIQDVNKAIAYSEQLEARKKKGLKRDSQINKARLLIQNKRYPEAIQIFTSLVHKNERDLEAKLYLARTLVLDGQIDRARGLYASVRKESPENIDVLIGEGYLLLKENDTEAAIKKFQEAVQLDSNNQDALKGIDLIKSRIQEKLRLGSIKNKQARIKSMLTGVDKLIRFKDYSIAEEMLSSALEEFPDHADLSFQLVRIKIFKKKYKESLDLLQKLIQRNPQNMDYLNLRGRVYMATDKLEKADSDFRKVLLVNSQNEEARKGVLQIKNIRIQKVRKGFENRKNDFIQTQLESIKTFLANKNYEDAIGLCRATLKKYPNELEVEIQLARALTLNSAFKEAENLYSVLIKKFPLNSDLFVGQGYLYFRKGQLEQAQQSFIEAKKIDGINEDADEGLLLIQKRRENELTTAFLYDAWGKANKLIANGDYAGATQIYQEVLEKYPDNLDTKIFLARAYRLDSKIAEAENLLEELVENHPENPDVWIEKGQLYSLKGDVLLSEQSFETALSLRSGDKEIQDRLTRMSQDRAYAALAKTVKTLEQNNEFDSAEVTIRNALRKDPQNSQISFLLARNLRFQGKYEESIVEHNKLLNNDPENIDYLASRGMVWRILNQVERAKSDYDKALKMDPNGIDLLLGRGYVSILEREYFQAKEFFQQALKIDPSYPETKEAMIQIENFVKDTVIESFYTESFSGGRDTRMTQNLEWIHPFSSKFRGNLGFEGVFVSKTRDFTGFIGGNYDVSDDFNIRGKFSYSPDPDIVAKQIYETELTKSFKKYSFEALFMHRYMNFKDTQFHLFSPGINYYVNEKTQVLLRGYMGFQESGNSHSTFVNINHDFSPTLSGYIGGSIGSASFRLLSGTDTQVVDSISTQMGLKWRASDRFSLNLNYVYEERENQFNRNLLGITIPVRF